MKRAAAALAMLALIAGAVLLLSSCSKQPPPEPIPSVTRPTDAPEPAPVGEPVKIGILTNAIAPFWDPMVVGMKLAEKDPTVMPSTLNRTCAGSGDVRTTERPSTITIPFAPDRFSALRANAGSRS